MSKSPADLLNDLLISDLREFTICPACGCATTFLHDHKLDNSGLDDGPPEPVRKKADPKPTETLARIRAQAWETRRAKYGERGHR
jgi:hypothetical protein